MTEQLTVVETVETVEVVEMETTPKKKVITLDELNSNPSFTLLDVSTDTMSVAQFMERLNVFLFNDPIQRNMVWGLDKKSGLIVSILEDVSIGEVKVELVRRSKKKYRNVLDGKQRLTTIRDFLLNKYALVEGSLIEMIDEDEGETIFIDMSGKKFEDLPVMFQNKLKSLNLDIKGYEDLTEEKKSDLFKRWNNGEQLTSSQLRKAKMPLDILVAIAALKEYPVFQAGFSETALKKDNHQDMILKAMMVLATENNTSLGSKDVDKFVETLNLSDVVLFKTLAEYAQKVYDAIENEKAKGRNAFGVAKTVSFMYVIQEAYAKDVDVETVAKWVEKFMVEATDLGYTASAATTSKDKVVERNELALLHFNETAF